MNPPRPFMLLHGAFRGGWGWQLVRPSLVAAGHDVHAPSLLGCADRRREALELVRLDDWVNQVVALLEHEDLREVVLVAHSQAGIVARAVASRVPERLACVVQLDAALTAPGERAVDLTPSPGPLPGPETWIPPRPLSDDCGLDAGLRAWVDARLSPTPLGPSLDVVPVRETSVPEHVFFCSDTPPGYPSTVSRARRDAAGESYVLLRTGHDAPFQAPDLVADHLLRIAASPQDVVPGLGRG